VPATEREILPTRASRGLVRAPLVSSCGGTFGATSSRTNEEMAEVGVTPAHGHLEGAHAPTSGSRGDAAVSTGHTGGPR
jgi:hypothetical protein